MKSQIETVLKLHLRSEGIELIIAANDNVDLLKHPLVELEAIQNKSLQGSALLSEISVILRLLGKTSDCKALIEGIYEALHPHYITPQELTVLLMSLHIEELHCDRPRFQKKRTTMRYIVEAQEERFDGQPQTSCRIKEEYC